MAANPGTQIDNNVMLRSRGRAGGAGSRCWLVAGNLLRHARVPGIAQSITESLQVVVRGGKSDEAAPSDRGRSIGDRWDLSRRQVSAGASTTRRAPGKQAAGKRHRYQATIPARACLNLNAGQITGGSESRRSLSVPPARRPTVEIRPRRGGQGGSTRRQSPPSVVRTTVSMGEGLTVRSAWSPRISSNPRCPRYQRFLHFYIGFDPQALKPSRSRRR